MLCVQIDHADLFTLHLQVGADVDGRCSLANPAFAGYNGYNFAHGCNLLLKFTACFIDRKSAQDAVHYFNVPTEDTVLLQMF